MIFKVFLLYGLLAFNSFAHEQVDVHVDPSKASTSDLISAASNLLIEDATHHKELCNELLKRETETQKSLLSQAKAFKKKGEDGEVIGSVLRLQEAVLVGELFGKNFQYEILKLGLMHPLITRGEIDILVYSEVFDIVSYNRDDSKVLFETLSKRGVLSDGTKKRWLSLIEGTHKPDVRSIKAIWKREGALNYNNPRSIDSNLNPPEQEVQQPTQNIPFYWVMIVSILALLVIIFGAKTIKR